MCLFWTLFLRLIIFYLQNLLKSTVSSVCFFASSLHRRIPLYSELSAGADAKAVELEPADAAAGGSHATSRGGGFAAFTTRSQQARLFLPPSKSVPDPWQFGVDPDPWTMLLTNGSRFGSGFAYRSCSYRH
jgi:hypothetical protein